MLRPEPDCAVTAAAVEARGYRSIRLPLFTVKPLRWRAPDPAEYDALIITSANALRHGGPDLALLAQLPVVAVGGTTAAAARRCGFTVAAVGKRGVEEAVETARSKGLRRLLHLAGRDRKAASAVSSIITVYASEELPIPAERVRACRDAVALLHSARAARRWADLVDAEGIDRTSLGIMTISAAVRDAAGPGWRSAIAASAPDAASLLDLLPMLAD